MECLVLNNRELGGKPDGGWESHLQVPEHLVAAIDTSGSMSENLLSQILSELDRIKSVSECRLSLIECDYDIGRVQEVEPWEASGLDFNRWQFTGRGGTSLKPPFHWLDQQIQNEGLIPDAMNVDYEPVNP